MKKELSEFIHLSMKGPAMKPKPKPKTEKWDLVYDGVRVQGAIAAPYGVCMAEKAKLKRMAGYREQSCKIKPHKF